MAILAVNGLSKSYGALKVTDGVSLSVAGGEVQWGERVTDEEYEKATAKGTRP